MANYWKDGVVFYGGWLRRWMRRWCICYTAGNKMYIALTVQGASRELLYEQFRKYSAAKQTYTLMRLFYMQ